MPLALLEHISLNILDRESAYAFYVTGLGGRVNDPTTNGRQLHVNLGASQFHLLLQTNGVEGPSPVSAAQVWAGHIELWSREPLHQLFSRLQKIGSDPSVSEPPSGVTVLSVTCPYGNQFFIRQAPQGFDPQLHGAHPSGSGTLIALTRAVHLVRPGAAARLRDFWSSLLGATCEFAEHGDDPPTAHCVVRFGSGQQLIFDERVDAPAADAYECDEANAYHICVCRAVCPDIEHIRPANPASRV